MSGDKGYNLLGRLRGKKYSTITFTQSPSILFKKTESCSLSLLDSEGFDVLVVGSDDLVWVCLTSVEELFWFFTLTQLYKK